MCKKAVLLNRIKNLLNLFAKLFEIKKKTLSIHFFRGSIMSLLVVPRGIEPLIPPWEGGVLTAWPWDRFLLDPHIITFNSKKINKFFGYFFKAIKNLQKSVVFWLKNLFFVNNVQTYKKISKFLNIFQLLTCLFFVKVLKWFGFLRETENGFKKEI